MIQERTAGVSPFALRSCALKKHNIYPGLQLLLRFKSAKVTKKTPTAHSGPIRPLHVVG